MTKKTKTKYKKAPQAPRRFKSAYMFFSTTKHKEIREELGAKGVTEKTTNIAKLVSQAWKDLSAEEREKWDKMAQKDKLRFEVEKSLYTGPWKVPAKKLSQKDPNAPKRPMSAFLAYSHSKRADVKAKNEGMNNAEISRVLASMWREATDEEKKDYIDEEYILRQKYLREIAVWRERAEKELTEQRRQREEIALQTVEARENGTIANIPSQQLLHHPPTGNAAMMEDQQMTYDKDGRHMPRGAPTGNVHDEYYSTAAGAQYYGGASAAAPPPYRQDMAVGYPPPSAYFPHSSQYDKYPPANTAAPTSIPDYYTDGSYSHMNNNAAAAAAAAAANEYYNPHTNYGYYGYPPHPPPESNYPPYPPGGYPGAAYSDYSQPPPPQPPHPYGRGHYDHAVMPPPPPPAEEDYDHSDNHYRHGARLPSLPAAAADYHHSPPPPHLSSSGTAPPHPQYENRSDLNNASDPVKRDDHHSQHPNNNNGHNFGNS